ncbi:ceramidase domain-containing protein [Roseicyclus sp. F158]|uniref:Ceramidase domain-containing protein n=1 Tax=Tropicimonas omnivorans TaxID=3075590 RepID=A0ABU3DEH1_9RHOB|nr:ceramidase domain-containing protein [Roseicyclus sp. F158]MDT0682114.1 ceramidase domain-containing protein [Roseicyclus sp. F158]
MIDAYCERLEPGLWAEPVNAITNAAFILAALVMWRRSAGRGTPLALMLSLVLLAIGIGSALFHTFATPWASVADTTPILVFILLYVFAANLHFWRMPVWAASICTAAFVPYAALFSSVFYHLPFFSISAPYWPVPLLIAGYAILLRSRDRELARGLGIGAALLTLSLVARSLDASLCASIPIGTHWLWHLLNAAMLGWMIEVYLRARARQRSALSPEARAR